MHDVAIDVGCEHHVAGQVPSGYTGDKDAV